MVTPAHTTKSVFIQFAEAHSEEGHITFADDRPLVVDGLIEITTRTDEVMYVSLAQITKIIVHPDSAHDTLSALNI